MNNEQTETTKIEARSLTEAEPLIKVDHNKWY